MRGNRSFDNIFISNGSRLESSRSSGFFPSLKESQNLETSGHFRQQSSVFSYHPVYCDQNVLTRQNAQQSSLIYESQIPGKQSLLLERSRSQIIQPVYLSPFKNTLGEDLDQSKELGASKASQITFSKPSEFIINTPKQNVYLESTKRTFMPTPQISADDYGYTFGSFKSLNPKMKDSMISVSSPMKQSFLAQTFNPCGNSIVINHQPQIVPQIRKHISSPILQSNIFNQPKAQILKNPSSTGFTIRPSLRRCLSNVSIFSQKSQSKLSQSKIKFNYISPPKSESKMGRKISFKNQDVKNPLSKLTKKKQQKSKISQNARPKINSEAVNQYFPQFKIKKNKMKIAVSSEAKSIKVVFDVKNKNDDNKSELSENSQRRNTFIASLDALSQLSEIKPVQKEVSTRKIIVETPQKIPQSVFEYLSIESNTKIQQKSIGFNKIAGYRITLDGQKVPLSSPRKEEVPSIKGSQVSKEVSKDSQLSVNSMKNGGESEFVKKNGNDSSHTTDYEDEIVKKIKEDLGLHFSYYKKK